MSVLLAAIIATPEEVADALEGLRENVPPVAVPWPAWMWWAIAGGVVIAAGLLVWLGIWLARRAPKTPPPTPREIALREIEALRPRVNSMEPYAFSVVVSDILRTYVSGHFGLHATQQTSPEFLASISRSELFTDSDRKLLAVFLERCDLLKFARAEAHAEENTGLLREAAAFIQGAAG